MTKWPNSMACFTRGEAMRNDFHPEHGDSPLECAALLLSVILMPFLMIVALIVL